MPITQQISQDILERAGKIKLLLMDCDGVLTDGTIQLRESGDEIKTFHVRDGQGIVLLHKAGLVSGIISGRNSRLVEKRADELGIKFVRQGSWDKLKDFEEILEEVGYSAEETAYVGDDIADIPLLEVVGLAIAVADAVEEVKRVSHFVTNKNGGLGAIREVSELILKAQNKWNIDNL